jgi:hypothetical protein
VVGNVQAESLPRQLLHAFPRQAGDTQLYFLGPIRGVKLQIELVAGGKWRKIYTQNDFSFYARSKI